jgi:hypothetical protein
MGALVLNNFPKDLLDFTLPYDHPPTRIDLATVDIVRDRERGVPRINNLRRGVGLPAFKNWEDLNPDPQVIAKLKSVYKSIEDVDCLVGMAAEMVSMLHTLNTHFNPGKQADHLLLLFLFLISLVLLVGHSEIPPLRSLSPWLPVD